MSAAGGNAVSASATLFSQDLERNGLTSKDDIARVIELGRGKMPGYGEACAPKGRARSARVWTRRKSTRSRHSFSSAREKIGNDETMRRAMRIVFSSIVRASTSLYNK